MRIVYFINSICHLGGRESITIAKANALAEIEGNEVWIMVSDNQRDPIYPLNSRVHLVHLGINYYDNDYKGRLYVWYNMLVRPHAHKKAAKKALEVVQPDVIVSTSHAEKFFLPSIGLAKRPLFVRELHISGDYRVKASLGGGESIIAYAKDLYDYKWRINEYDVIVTLTEGDKKSFWSNNSKVVVMPNLLTCSLEHTSDLSSKIIVMAGRLIKTKNFTSAIYAWKKVVTKHKDWQLHIWGSGAEEETLQRLILELNLQESVILQGYTNDLGNKYLHSSIFLQTSLSEGFPLVLIEAMNAGLPCIAYDCPYGPSDVIDDGRSGYLLKLNDEKQLAERMICLIEDNELRSNMGKEARKTSLRYLAQHMAIKWMELFKENIEKLQLK